MWDLGPTFPPVNDITLVCMSLRSVQWLVVTMATPSITELIGSVWSISLPGVKHTKPLTGYTTMKHVSLAALPSSLICGMLRVVDHQEDQYLQYIITDACYGQIPNPFQFELSLSELQELLIRI